MAITLPGITILHFRGDRVIERFSHADMLGPAGSDGGRRQPEPGSGLNPPSSGYGRSVCLPTVSRGGRIPAGWPQLAWWRGLPSPFVALPASLDGRLH